MRVPPSPPCTVTKHCRNVYKFLTLPLKRATGSFNSFSIIFPKHHKVCFNHQDMLTWVPLTLIVLPFVEMISVVVILF